MQSTLMVLVAKWSTMQALVRVDVSFYGIVRNLALRGALLLFLGILPHLLVDLLAKLLRIYPTANCNCVNLCGHPTPHQSATQSKD